MDPVSHDARTELEIVSLESGSNPPVRSLALDSRFSAPRIFNSRVEMQPGGNSVVYAINQNGVDNLWRNRWMARPAIHSPTSPRN
jgi:hypothetical protein